MSGKDCRITIEFCRN